MPSLIDLFMTVSQIVGILIVTLVGFCVLVFLIFAWRFAVVSYDLSIKAQKAKHISADAALEVNDNASFFQTINDDIQAEERRKTYVPREEYISEPMVEFRNATAVRDDRMTHNRFKLGYTSSTPVFAKNDIPDSHEGVTMVYDALPIPSTPPDGVIFVDGEAQLHTQDQPPFNLKDSNEAPATQPH